MIHAVAAAEAVLVVAVGWTISLALAQLSYYENFATGSETFITNQTRLPITLMRNRDQ